MNDTQKQIDDLKAQLEELKKLFFKDNFSNLKIYNKPVQFNNGVILSFDPDTTAAGAYKGRIAITVNGVTQYLHYYDA